MGSGSASDSQPDKVWPWNQPRYQRFVSQLPWSQAISQTHPQPPAPDAPIATSSTPPAASTAKPNLRTPLPAAPSASPVVENSEHLSMPSDSPLAINKSHSTVSEQSEKITETVRKQANASLATEFPFEKLTPETITKASSSLGQAYKNAWQMAAYFGFPKKLQYHKLQFSWQVLTGLDLFLKYRSGEGYLAILHDMFPDSSGRTASSKLCTSLSDVEKMYPLEGVESQAKRTNCDFGLASIVYATALSLESSIALPLSDEVAARISNLLTRKDIHQFYNWEDAPVWDLGPFVGEIPVEKYHRIFLLYHSTSHQLSDSQINDAKLRNPQENRLFTQDGDIPANLTPLWMRPAVLAPEIKIRQPRFAPKSFKLQWLRNAGPKSERSELEEHLTDDDGWFREQGLDLPPEECVVAMDPRFCVAGEQWRDTLREQLGVYAKRLEIRWLDLKVDGKRTNIYGKPSKVPWRDLMPIFLSENPVVELRLEPIPIEQEWPMVEWYGAPPDVEAYMTVDTAHRVVANEDGAAAHCDAHDLE